MQPILRSAYLNCGAEIKKLTEVERDLGMELGGIPFPRICIKLLDFVAERLAGKRESREAEKEPIEVKRRHLIYFLYGPLFGPSWIEMARPKPINGHGPIIAIGLFDQYGSALSRKTGLHFNFLTNRQ